MKKRLLCMLLCLILCGALFCASGTEDGEEGWTDLGFEVSHSLTFFDINDLPYSTFMAVSQTPDGFIYLGGYGGLLRYDGKKFEQVPEISSVVSLYTAWDGGLWVGTNDGQIIRMGRNGSFLRFTVDAVAIRAIAADGRGRLLFGTDQGLYCMLERSSAPTRIDDARLTNVYITQLNADADGDVYGVTEGGQFFVIHDLAITCWDNADSLGKTVSCITPDPDREGWVYLGTANSEILHGSLSSPLEDFAVLETPGLTTIKVIRFVEGRMWICSASGLGYVDGKGCRVLPYKALNNEEAMYVDYEGNLWFASSRTGAVKITRTRFDDLNKISPLDDLVVNTTWMEDGLLYVGTDTGLVIIDSGGVQYETPLTELLKNTRIRAIKSDSRGDLWICTVSDHGLVRVDKNGGVKSYTTADGLISNRIRTIYEMSDGTLAISVVGGVHLMRDGRIIKSYDDVPTPYILSLCEGQDGRLYLGSNGRGVYVLEEDRIAPFEGESDLESGVIMGFRRDDRRNCLWLLTGNSIGVIKDGRAYSLRNIEPVMGTGGCFELLFRDNGQLLVMDGTGLYLLDGDRLLAGETVGYEYYSVSNGLPHIATANSRNYLSPDGYAYISCSDGITRLNINASDQGADPKLAVPFVDVDEEHRYTNGTVTIGSRAKRIVIYPYILSNALTNPKVSYCLEGFDGTPTEVTKEELAPVSYTNLRGGTYTFKLWNEYQFVTVTIVKEKAIYEQPLFWVLVALLFVLANYIIIRQLMKRQERQVAKRKEQEYIVRDLRMAADIQAGALPSDFPERQDLELCASMDPARDVGGDFYDFFLIDEDHLGLVMADVSGKGIPAALFMMSAKSLIKTEVMIGNSPAEALRKVNDQVCANNEMDMFVTVWLGILEISTGKLTCSNAGHEYPVLCRSGHFEIFKDKHGLAIGGLEDMSYTEYTLQLERGDKLFVYTDGIPEAINGSREFFGMDRMVEALNDASSGAPREILAAVRQAVDGFVGNSEQFDDLTMLCLRYIGPAKE